MEELVDGRGLRDGGSRDRAGLVLADVASVILAELDEHDGRENCDATEYEESQVDAVNQLTRIGVKAIGNEERGDE